VVAVAARSGPAAIVGWGVAAAGIAAAGITAAGIAAAGIAVAGIVAALHARLQRVIHRRNICRIMKRVPLIAAASAAQ
jgi:hypothetical protein